MDKKENKKIPHCLLSTNLLDFGPVRLNTPVTKTITVTNQTKLSVSKDFKKM